MLRLHGRRSFLSLGIMSPREIYAALFNSRGPVGAPSGEWKFVGDTGSFEPERLSLILTERIDAPKAYVAVSRNTAAVVDTDSLPSIVCEYLAQDTVRISDLTLKRFVEVSPIGVARAWPHDA